MPARDEGSIVVAAFCGPGLGHFGALAPVIAGLVSLGHRVTVYAPAALRGAAIALGARFTDLYEHFPLERVDRRSIPYPCRSISHAGFFAEELIARITEDAPQLIVYETFAVAGRLVGHALEVPHVNVCPVHRLSGTADEIRAIAESRKVVIDAACAEAVAVLRRRYGLTDANPFWYLSARSPYLNLYCEPAAFLEPEERAQFAPVAFFGSLPWGAADDGERAGESIGRTSRRLCIAFGTVIWDYFASTGVETIRRVAIAVREHRGAEVIVGLGGWQGAPAQWVTSLEQLGISVHAEIDQWTVLSACDLLATHHGLKSVHEAIFHGVPMLSFPFFSDQPGLAQRCQALGLAEPVCLAPRSLPETSEVLDAFDRLEAKREVMRERLAQARRWELETLRGRPRVLDEVIALAGDRGAREVPVPS